MNSSFLLSSFLPSFISSSSTFQDPPTHQQNVVSRSCDIQARHQTTAYPSTSQLEHASRSSSQPLQHRAPSLSQIYHHLIIATCWINLPFATKHFKPANLSPQNQTQSIPHIRRYICQHQPVQPQAHLRVLRERTHLHTVLHRITQHIKLLLQDMLRQVPDSGIIGMCGRHVQS